MANTFGAEIEKPISDIQSGTPHGVTQEFFRNLAKQSEQRGEHPHLHSSDIQDTVLGVISEIGEQGLDNGFNNQETSTAVLNSLEELGDVLDLDINTIQTALAAEGATAINLSNHPLGSTDEESYKAFVAPKSVYDLIRWRGWNHQAGIDAKAQNSPSTGVEFYEAADAVTTIIGAGAAFVGIFANSPYSEGKASGLMESRLGIWDTMMENSRVKGDVRVSRFPDEPFNSLTDYFMWTHGGDSGIHFVIGGSNDAGYKSAGDRLLIVDGDPNVMDYLASPKVKAHKFTDVLAGVENPASIDVVPNISHMEAMQFAQFAGARIRYSLSGTNDFPTAEFAEACKAGNSQKVDDILRPHVKSIWIEGRDPGNNLPDSELAAAGVADSVIVAPSVLQAGLIKNLGEARSFIDRFNWKQLGELRATAIRDGLDGEVAGISVRNFSNAIYNIAMRGLSAEDQKMLRYVEYVFANGNGAERAIEFMEKNPSRTLKDLVKSRQVITQTK